MNKTTGFPFSAVAGQDDVKLALILNLINPVIGGVLISGEKGTAKSTLVRALAQMRPGTRVVGIPLGVTEDRLTGGLDFEAAVKHGRRAVEKGLLSDADGQILYIDEVNLLSDHLVNILLTVSSMGENIVEREGVSLSHPCRFVLIGSMNPEEGLLRPSFLDRFGLYVAAKGEKDIALRTEIMKRRLEYEDDPAGFCREYAVADAALSSRIDRAADLLPQIGITEAQYEAFAQLASRGGCAGHRCEIVLAETAKAIAAWNGRVLLTDEDIALASKYVLPHRLREPLPCVDQPDAADEGGADEPDGAQLTEQQDIPPTGSDRSRENESAEDTVDEAGKRPDLSVNMSKKRLKRPAGSGKRNRAVTGGRSGRYVKARLPEEKATDIALDATLRAAASHQHGREVDSVAIVIERDDIRAKVREKRTGAVILFVVDASGSMGARRRMRAVKGAVLTLLEEAYQKRDKVAIVSFRGNKAEVTLGITRSVDLAEKQLRSLPTGGRTPLAAGLMQAYQLLLAEKLKDRDAQVYLVLITDGKANVPLFTGDAFQDALETAKKIRSAGLEAMVLDTENGYIRFNQAEKLAKIMDAAYTRLDAVTTKEITSNVKDLIMRKK